MSWANLVPPAEGAGLNYRNTIRREIGHSAGNVPIDGWLYQMPGGGSDAAFVLDPPYQRGRVWTRAQAESFVGFVAEGGRAPAIYVRERPSFCDEIVDGKQRLLALWGFVTGEHGARLESGRVNWWRDFNVADRLGFKTRTIPRIRLREEITTADILEIYLRLNRGGTPHTDAEIKRVEALLDAERAAT